ncbi:glycosyltransferase family 4 protein [Kiritimatiellaeota bacterium B1221]|nr:glycosyltransferase family 4 protein [Kiritimatiellaeota bacterium B1221]
MATRAIHQLLAGYSNGDAISNEARTLRSWFQKWGFESEIYCEAARILPELRKVSRDVSTLLTDVDEGDVVMLHLSIGSDVNDILPQLKCKTVIRYHNVTPEGYFRALDEHLAGLLAKGRVQMKALAGVADLNLAVSSYNAGELSEAGYQDIQVLPLALELRRLDAKPNREVIEKYRDGKINVLFVGRCVPNKRLEDLLYAFYYLQKFQTPNCRLIHVGSFAGAEAYLAMLQSLKRELGLEHVNFVGSVPEADLCAYYQVADLFLCMSEHEGFGIPLLEAMQAELPVMAYASSAVPETMAGAGFLFKEKIFDELAAWIPRLAGEGVLREEILAGQRRRLEAYDAQDIEGRLRELLQPLI